MVHNLKENHHANFPPLDGCRGTADCLLRLVRAGPAPGRTRPGLAGGRNDPEESGRRDRPAGSSVCGRLEVAGRLASAAAAGARNPAGATLPGLSIKGEVGQQLGYLNAMGVGMLNFAILVLIGLAFSHQATTKRILSRLSGGRLKLPPEEEYRA